MKAKEIYIHERFYEYLKECIAPYNIIYIYMKMLNAPPEVRDTLLIWTLSQICKPKYHFENLCN
jgi:hypothetical protein